MLRVLFLLALLVLLLATIAWAVGRMSGRPLVADPIGKILLAITVAALGFWLFGGGALLGGAG